MKFNTVKNKFNNLTNQQILAEHKTQMQKLLNGQVANSINYRKPTQQSFKTPINLSVDWCIMSYNFEPIPPNDGGSGGIPG